uniref:Uncharacterized protein n=1 Tax=Lygus hesperus TaxID=30085 RepID=A0A146M4W8_LYGHE
MLMEISTVAALHHSPTTVQTTDTIIVNTTVITTTPAVTLIAAAATVPCTATVTTIVRCIRKLEIKLVNEWAKGKAWMRLLISQCWMELTQVKKILILHPSQQVANI